MDEVASTGKSSCVDIWTGTGSSAWYRTVDSLVRQGLLKKRGTYLAMLPMDVDHMYALDENRERHSEAMNKKRTKARWG
jgi:hypothetical protein